MTIKTGFDYYPEADRKIKPMSKAEYSQEEMYPKLMEQYRLEFARIEALESEVERWRDIAYNLGYVPPEQEGGE